MRRRSIRRAIALGGGAGLLALAIPAAPALSNVLLIDEPPIVNGTVEGPGRSSQQVRLPPMANGEMPPEPNQAALEAHKARQDAHYALTSDELARAKRIVAEDTYLKGLFRGVSFTMGHFGSWKGPDDDAAHGAVMDLTLSRPISSRMTDLPVIEELPGEAYERGTFQASISNAAQFRVIVDFSTGGVAEVMPINDGTAEFRPGPRNPARGKSEGR